MGFALRLGIRPGERLIGSIAGKHDRGSAGKQTRVGVRTLALPTGDQLPRIC